MIILLKSEQANPLEGPRNQCRSKAFLLSNHFWFELGIAVPFIGLYVIQCYVST